VVQIKGIEERPHTKAEAKIKNDHATTTQHEGSHSPHMEIRIQKIPDKRVRASSGMDKSQTNNIYLYTRLPTAM
jgi:hypothetical protein